MPWYSSNKGNVWFDNDHATLDPGQYGRYNKVTGYGTAFSPNNPAYIQMQFAQSKEELMQLRQEAIEWEINNANLQEQRAYEEQYNHPLAQMQRMRQAGGNPDLVGSGGSGGVSPGAASAATMQPATVDSMPTPHSTASVVFQGVEATGSLLTSLSSTLNAGIDFGQKVASFASQTSLNKSTALQKEIETLGDIASMIPSDLPAEEFAQMVRSFVPDADDTFVSRVSAYNKSPQAQEAYARFKNLANREAAQLSAYTPRTLKSMYSVQAYADTMATELSALRGFLDKALFEGETGLQFIPTEDDSMAVFDDESYTSPEVQRRRSSNRLSQKQTERDLSKYLSLAAVVDALAEMADNDAKFALQEYDKNPTSENWERYLIAYVNSLSMFTLQSNELREVFKIFGKHELIQSISDVVLSDGGKLLPFNTDTHTRYYDFYKLLFGDGSATSTPLTDMSKGILEIIKAIGLKRVPGVPKR